MNVIVAADKNWGIGRDNGLLVHLPGDLKYFKERTMGKVLIMGRRTLESLPGARPLPGRTTIVLTGNLSYVPEALCGDGEKPEAAKIAESCEKPETAKIAESCEKPEAAKIAESSGKPEDVKNGKNNTRLMIAHSQEELTTMLLTLEFSEGIDIDEDVFVAGGEKVYADMFPYCNKFFVTSIDAEFDADKHFINMDELESSGMVKKTFESDMQEEKGVRYCFRIYERD